MAKKQLRRRMRALRDAHGPMSLAKRSSAICTRLFELIEDKAGVALFWPMVGSKEVDLRSLDARLREKSGLRIYYPFMDPRDGGGYTTGFRLSESAHELLERGRGFCEPPVDAPIAERGEIDLVLVPALAADARGHRIGYGAGYYDATLGDICPPGQAWVIAYQFQLMAELPTEDHDVACDAVVTDEKYYQVV